MKYFLNILVLFSFKIVANPTSGWDDIDLYNDSSGGSSSGDIWFYESEYFWGIVLFFSIGALLGMVFDKGDGIPLSKGGSTALYVFLIFVIVQGILFFSGY